MLVLLAMIGAFAAPAASGAVSPEPCIIATLNAVCQTSNPQVLANFVSQGDTSSCSFRIRFDWGDGTTSDVTTNGRPTGSTYLISHVYARLGVYSGKSTTTLLSGPCGVLNGTFQITLVAGGPSTGAQGGSPTPDQMRTVCNTDEPVNCATGAFWHTFTDAAVRGRVGLQFARTYSSTTAAASGPLGFGWATSYGMRVSFDASGNATVREENGSEIQFFKNAGLYFPATGVLASLTPNDDGTYTLTRNATNVQYVFSAGGRLIRQVDRNGHTTSLNYNGSGDLTEVMDPAGRSLTMAYGGGHLVSMSDPTGSTTSYRYDASGNLTSSVDPLGRTWTFTYGPNHLLTSMTDPNGGTTTNTYDGSNRVTRQVDPVGRATTWQYAGDAASAAGGTTTITDPRGVHSEQQYSNLELTSVTNGVGTPQEAKKSFQYDVATLGRVKVTDPNGNVTTNAYDSRGDLLRRTDPLGNVTKFTYNALGDPLTAADALGTTSTYAYDSNGNVLSRSTPLTGGGVAKWTYTYGSGATAGDLLTSTDPNEKTTVYGYDAAGNLTSTMDGLGEQSAATYDGDGRTLSWTAPNGGTTANTYDAGGELTKITDPLGQSTRYGYDRKGNRVSWTDADGRTTTYGFNADDELTQVTRPDGSTRTTTYDGDGNVLTQIDGNGHATSYTYDPLDRVATTTDPDGHTTSTSYDRAGNLLTRVDPSGRTTTYTYDADDRMTKTDYSDVTTPDVTQSYDADGNRITLSDGTGAGSFTYDTLGNLASQTDGAGATSGYGRDPAGNITSITYPNGRIVHRTYDAAGDLIGVTDWLGHTTTFGYDGDRNLTTTALPGAVTSTSTYNVADRLTAIVHQNAQGPLAHFDYTRDAIGRLASSTASGPPSQTDSYGYDAANRLIGAGSEHYGYDAADNPTAYVNGRVQTFDPADELLTSTTGSGPDLGAGGPGGSESGGGDGGGAGAGSGATNPAKVTVAAIASTHRIGKRRALGAHLTGAPAGGHLLAFVSAAGPKNRKQTAATPTTRGLKWVLVTSGSSRGGAVSIWQAPVTRKLTGVAVTTRLRRPSSQAQLTVIAIEPGAAIGSHANRAGKTGALRLALAAPLGAEVWAVGHDADNGARPIASGSGRFDVETHSRGRHAASWVQHATVTKAGKTAIGLRARISKSWSLAGVTVQPAVRKPSRALLGADTRRREPPAGYLRARETAADVATQRTFTYNPNGDRVGVTVNGATVSFGYDQASRLTSVSGGIGYSYDGDGLRARKTVDGTITRFVWERSGNLPLLLQDGDTSYIYGPGDRPIEQITDEAATYLLADQHGSTRLLTDDAGVVVGRYGYDAWGNVTGHTGTATTPLQYDGQYTDSESGLIYLRARSYDPTTGQFMTRDPLTALTRSLYHYASDDPVNGRDATGARAEQVGQAAAATARACQALAGAVPLVRGRDLVGGVPVASQGGHQNCKDYLGLILGGPWGEAVDTAIGPAVNDAVCSSLEWFQSRTAQFNRFRLHEHEKNRSCDPALPAGDQPMCQFIDPPGLKPSP